MPFGIAAASHRGVMSKIRRGIGRRAVAIAALECGETKAQAAERAGITRNTLDAYLRPGWQPGA